MEREVNIEAFGMGKSGILRIVEWIRGYMERNELALAYMKQNR